MIILVWIITSIIMFSIIVLLHEYGHFKTARIFWVKVEEFWLWIPPKAKTIYKDKSWTIYTLNYLPIWWFVRLKWENINTFDLYDENKKQIKNEDLEKKITSKQKIFDKENIELNEELKNQIVLKLKENNDKDSLLNKKSRQQAIIILAWVFMNFLLAIVIYSVLFFVWVSPIWINSKIETDVKSKIIPTLQQAKEMWFLIEKPWVYLSPIEWSVALKYWIKSNDLLLKINDIEINKVEQVKDIIKNNPNKELNFFIERGVDCMVYKDTNCKTQKINIKLTTDNSWKIGTYISWNLEINKSFKYKESFFTSIKYWIIETYSQIKLTFVWLKTLLEKLIFPKTQLERTEAINQVSGPIWIVNFITNSIWNWIVFIMIISASISINLWVFNLLPIPALDGWRFIFITINWLIWKMFGKKLISINFENILHFVFFIFFIALSLIIAYNDLWKIFN